jgi:NAD(P)H-quinone oxidoreductase subunit 5
MTSGFVWLAAIGPLSLLGGYLLPAFSRSMTAVGANRAAGLLSALALVIAFVSAASVARLGAMHTPSLSVAGIGFGIYLDSLSVTMFCLVSFIGLIVLRYSFTYMDGDQQRTRFTRLLCLTLSAVLTLAISGSLFQFTLAWAATSMALQRLLLFYPERPAAVIAARKKFLASRLGEVCLVAAIILLYRAFGSLDYGPVFAGCEQMRAAASAVPSIEAASLLMVMTALLKSAQFPLHGWLLEVMETPTPVSALLHAGIINAGGFLVLRFTAIISLSLPALDVLAVVGGFTALFGSVVMLTQTSIKSSLACSTVAQMGFMMLECGLGAFSAALLHIVAHSLYKAHAFLSSGSIIDIARASWTPSPGGKPHPLRLIFAIACVLALTLLFSVLTGATPLRQPGVFALGAVLLLGVIHLIANGIDERPNSYVIGRTLLLAGIVGALYFSLQLAAKHLFAGALPEMHPARGPFGLTVVGMVVLSFAAVTFVQGMVRRNAGAPRWQSLYVHVANGLYVNTLANRLVLQFWPVPVPLPEAAQMRVGIGAQA